MRTRRIISICSVFVAVAVLLLSVSPSHAQIPAGSTCTNYAGLTNHIAGCVRDTLDNATAKFFNSQTGFFPLVSKAIGGMLSLAVIIFGVMAAFGMVEKLGRDSILLLLKIAFVGYFTMNSDFMYQNVIGMMDDISKRIVTYVPSSGPIDQAGDDFSQVTCLKDMLSTPETQAKGVVGPWAAMDCTIDSVIGIKVVATRTDTPTGVGDGKTYNSQLKADDDGPARGLLYLFFSSYQSSVLGVILAVIGFVFMWGMINMIIKSLFIYIAGYLGIAVMMMVAPLFIPMVLFQTTRTYFDKWVKLVISFALQPIIILVFVVMTIAAVDMATYSSKFSIMYRIAGDASLQPGFSLNAYLSQNRGTASAPHSIIYKDTKTYLRAKADTKAPITATSDDAVNKLVGGVANSPCTTAAMNADPDLKAKCAQSYPMQFWHNVLDWNAMAAARSPAVVIEADPNDPSEVVTAGEQISREVLGAVIFAAVVIFVMNQLLSVIPMVAYDLIGDFGTSPNLGAVGGSLPGQKQIKGQLESMVAGRR